jgi:hypothetical protein
MMFIDGCRTITEDDMRTIRIIAVTALAVLAGGFVAASPAAATEEKGGTLGIMITPLPGGSPSTPRLAVLTCEPTGGTHPRAAQACDEIAKVAGDIAAIPASGGCVDVWEPVTITARGTWQGKALDFTEEQTSVGCAMASHGVVFRI